MNIVSLVTLTKSEGDLMEGDAGPDLVSRSAQMANATHQAATAFINDLQWSAARSIRTSIITLASFNVIAAAATVACVLWDCYAVAKRNDPNVALRDFRPSFIGSHQVYPLILSLGVIVQGIMFAVAQSRGLEGLLIESCVPISQMMMAATFIVPFIQLIFGVETTIRVIPRHPFPERPKWVVPVCLFVLIAGIVALYGVTLSLPPPDECFATLFWFTQQWRPVSFGLLLGIASGLLVCLAAVFFRLRYGTVSSQMERTAASHMVYYMTVSVISNALLTPFFFSITFGDENESATYPMELSTVSSIVANLSGLMTGGLYLFLRGGRRSPVGFRRSDSFDFDPRYSHGTDHKRASRTWSGPSFGQRISTPSIYSKNDDGKWIFFRKPGVAQELHDSGKDEPSAIGMTVRPPSMQHPSNSRGSARNSTRPSSRRIYSFFNRSSQRVDSGTPSLLPSRAYTPDDAASSPAPGTDTTLLPPPLFHAPAAGHNRNSSMESSATVQIGLRLSNMNDGRRVLSSQFQSPRQTMRQQSTNAAPGPSFRWEPMVNDTHPSSHESIQRVLNKHRSRELPTSPAMTDGTEDTTKLSATVYSPQKPPPRAKLASPKGVGFQSAPGDRNGKKENMISPTANVATAKGGWI